MNPIFILLIAVGSFLFLFLLGYLYLIMPSMKRKKEMLVFCEHKYAHRGFHGDGAAENSLSAFSRAVERGYGIELDVRLTKDGRLVVFHDNTLVRITGKEGRVEDYDYREIEDLRLSGTDDKIPLFSEVLSLVDGKIPLLIELKEEAGKYSVTEKTLEILEGYKGAYIIESFNPLALKLIKKKRPEVLRGFLAMNYIKEGKHKTFLHFMLQCLLFNVASRPDFISFEHRDYKSIPLRLCRTLFGAVSFAWTITSPEEEKAAYDHKFDTVIFENYISENKK